MLSHVERAQQALSVIFAESPEATDLFNQLNNGLITPVEYSHKILDEWMTFISLAGVGLFTMTGANRGMQVATA